MKVFDKKENTRTKSSAYFKTRGGKWVRIHNIITQACKEEGSI